MKLAFFSVLFLLLLAVGGSRGVKTFFTFFGSLVLIVAYVLLMSFGINAILLAVITCVLAAFLSLYVLNGYNPKTKSSFISVMTVLALVFVLIYSIGKTANIHGYSMESVDSIGGFTFDINYSMANVLIGMYLVCIVGTVIDTSISVSSAMNEVLENNPDIKDKELFKSGMNVGGDILSTTINTLFFTLVGTFIGFFMWHSGASAEFIINYKVFVCDLIQLLISFIGSILIIPITAHVASRILLNQKPVDIPGLKQRFKQSRLYARLHHISQ
ncbi:MAG: YibE/F family protein [Clostridia bacterium]|nr:YibE/F family protein [Clostridia bacterium]